MYTYLHSTVVNCSLSLQKSKKESEEKHVIREGENSLITYPNASSYSVFAHVRHLVLQTKLCDTYNSRLSCDSAGETDAEEEEETAKKEEGKKMPVVVGLGVKGVFTIIRDIWHTHPELCLRALKEFLNILQGQSPSGLRDEPRESTGEDTFTCMCSCSVTMIIVVQVLCRSACTCMWAGGGGGMKLKLAHINFPQFMPLVLSFFSFGVKP